LAFNPTGGTPSSGSLGLDRVQAEFGGSGNIGMNEYYGCAYQVPTSGTIQMSQLRGKYRYWGGMRFTYRFFSVNTFNHRVERNGFGLGWQFRTYANPINNPGGRLASDGTQRHDANGGTIIEKLFWYYFNGWRLYIQTYRFGSPYTYQAQACSPAPYQRGFIVGMNNGAYVHRFGIQFGQDIGPYKIVTGDSSRRRIYAYRWPGTVSFSNYLDFQMYSNFL